MNFFNKMKYDIAPALMLWKGCMTFLLSNNPDLPSYGQLLFLFNLLKICVNREF